MRNVLPSVRETLLRRGPGVATVAAVVAFAVRHTVRDGHRLTAPFFYATPPALLVALAGGLLFIALRRRDRRAASLTAVLLAACGADVVATDVRCAPDGPDGAVRGMFWNVFQGHFGWAATFDVVRRESPDVAWLSECPEDGGRTDRFLRDAFPEHAVRRFTSRMVVVVRGDARAVETRELPGNGRAVVQRISVRGLALDALHVDLASDPLRDRRASFDVLDELKAPRLGGPLLVVGDFNTPRDSVCFDAWEAPLTHAFDGAGRGFAATWPMPLPVLALDHVWASSSLVIRTCALGTTLRSDHRPVVFTFDAAPPAAR